MRQLNFYDITFVVYLKVLQSYRCMYVNVWSMKSLLLFRYNGKNSN